jgi:hypothetical protein
MRIETKKLRTPRIEYSFEMAWAPMLAMHIANSRRHTRLAIDEFFGAIYLADPDNLARFWKERHVLDAFARKACDLQDPASFYWIEFHQALKRKKYGDGIFMEFSADLAEAMHLARRLATKASRGKRARPLVCAEHFLFAAAAAKRSEFGRQLISSGLNLMKLRRAVGQSNHKL